MKKYFIAVLLALLLLVSCSINGKDEFYKAHKKLADMKSYSAVADITVYGNKGTSEYREKQFFIEPNKLRVETLEPGYLKGRVLVYDGLTWKMFNPIIDQTTEMDNLRNDNQLVYLGIIQRGIFSGEDAEYKYADKNGLDYIEVKCTIPDGDKYRKWAVLYMTRDKFIPELLEILDDANKVKVAVKYYEFEYNRELNESLFNLK